MMIYHPKHGKIAINKKREIMINLKNIVISSLLLTLSAAVQAKNEWTNYSGNSARTQYLAQTTNPTKFRVLWSGKLKLADREDSIYSVISPAIISENIAYFTLHDMFTDPEYGEEAVADALFAVDINTGKILWKDGSKNVSSFSAPVVQDQNVYVMMTEYSGAGNSVSTLRSYDVTSGVLKYSVPLKGGFSPASLQFLPPAINEQKLTLANHDLYIMEDLPSEDQETYNIENLNVNTGVTNWVRSLNKPYILSALNSNDIFLGDKDFSVLSRADGLPKYNINSSLSYVSANTGVSTVVDEKNAVLFFFEGSGDGVQQLSAYDLSSKKIKWSLPYHGTKLALVDNTLYMVGHLSNKEECKEDEGLEIENKSHNDLISIDTNTGKINWKWRPDQADFLGKYSTELAATSDTIFVRGNKNTYAISMTTHQPVWKINKVGSLALGKDRLIISSYSAGFSPMTQEAPHEANDVTVVALN